MVDRFDKAIVKQKLIMAVKVALSCASAFVLGRYLQIAPQAVMEIALVFLILWCSHSLSLGELEMREIVCIGVFAALLSITLVLGFHISIGDSYSGTAADNFITPYSVFDVVAFLLMLYGSWVVFMRCYCAIKRASLVSREDGVTSKWMNRINVSEARVLEENSSIRSNHVRLLVSVFPGILPRVCLRGYGELACSDCKRGIYEPPSICLYDAD